MGKRVFLLSPASCAGNRARLLLAPAARSPLAGLLRSGAGAPLGDVFSFISQLYFRGKLAYARAFARVPDRWGFAPPPHRSSGDAAPGVCDGVLVITTSRGLVDWRTPVDLTALHEFAAVDMRLANHAYTRPLEAASTALARRLDADDQVVLLGSIASDKYVSVLKEVLGDRLHFPSEFVGRGDMSRGGLMLRCVADGRELTYIRLASSPRHGIRPPKLEPLRRPR